MVTKGAGFDLLVAILLIVLKLQFIEMKKGTQCDCVYTIVYRVFFMACTYIHD